MPQAEVELSAAGAHAALEALASDDRAKDLSWFFKTGPGQYGEGDIFLGCSVPQTRSLIPVFRSLPDGELDNLAASEFHECRLLALYVLVWRFEHAKQPEARAALFERYLDWVEAGYVNNWDLVDTSAPYFGKWLVEHPDAELLDRLVASPQLWLRRVAVMLTFAHIRAGQTSVAFEFAARVLGDREDLMHKAAGWMLREAGKRDLDGLREFLAAHSKVMPRTMLRYAIEKLAPEERKRWMQK